MKKKTAIISFIILTVIIGGILYYYFSGKEYVVRLTEEQISEKLKERLPLNKTYLFFIKVTFSNPRVKLKNGTSRVQTGLDVLFNITIDNNPKQLASAVDVSAGIDCVPEKGQFFLVNPVIEYLDIQGISEKYIDKVNKALITALTEYYKSYPVYTLSSVDIKQAAVKMILKSVIIKNKEVVLTIGI